MSVFSVDLLKSNLDASAPNAGVWGAMTILKGDLTTGLAYTANATTNQFTTATPHGLVTGSRIRLVGGTLPSPLLTGTDYFAIYVSATVFSLALTLSLAQAATSIDLADAGAGALTLSEQALLATDPLSVLINKEVSHPAWSARTIIDNYGAAIAVAGVAEKPQKIFSVANTATSNLSYQHYLFIKGATTVVGNPTGSGFIFEAGAAIVTIAPGVDPRAVFFKYKARNL
jgi:hypothetical protein